MNILESECESMMVSFYVDRSQGCITRHLSLPKAKFHKTALCSQISVLINLVFGRRFRGPSVREIAARFMSVSYPMGAWFVT